MKNIRLLSRQEEQAEHWRVIRRMKECAAWRALRQNLESPFVTNELRGRFRAYPKRNYSCGQRLCPWCSPNRFRRDHRDLIRALDEIGVLYRPRPGTSRCFLTLTAQQSKGTSLFDHGTMLLAATKEFLRDKTVRRYLAGGVVAFDVGHPDFDRDSVRLRELRRKADAGDDVAKKAVEKLRYARRKNGRRLFAHLHGVVDLHRVDLKKLNATWRVHVKAAGGAGGNAHLRRLASLGDTYRSTSYLMKNLAPRVATLKNEDEILELAKFVRGRRLRQRVGDWVRRRSKKPRNG